MLLFPHHSGTHFAGPASCWIHGLNWLLGSKTVSGGSRQDGQEQELHQLEQGLLHSLCLPQLTCPGCVHIPPYWAGGGDGTCWRYGSNTTPLSTLSYLASHQQQKNDLLGPSFSFEALHTEGDYIPHQLLHVWILPSPSASSWLGNSDGDTPLTTVCSGGLRAKGSFTRARGSGAFLSAYRHKHKPILLD